MRLPNWIRVEVGQVKYYVPWHFQSSGIVDCGFSTRAGGISKFPYSSLNLSLAVDDDPVNVLSNRRRFAAAMGIRDMSRIVVADQTHSSNVYRVTEDDAGRGALVHFSAIPDTDALITDVPGIPLALHFADCVAVFFLDTTNRAIGVAHAGWRGTVDGIVISTVEAMTREFGTDPSQLLVAIAPAIERHCYEVGEDVALPFFRAFPNDERVLSQSSSTKWRVDLKTANRILLERAGVDDANMAISEQCTSCNIDELFSYRRDGETGRMGGWLSLRQV
jgi:YfiH family protein